MSIPEAARSAARRVRQIAASSMELLLSAMAELEVRYGVRAADGRVQYWRLAHLDFLGVEHGRHVTVGQNIHIRWKGRLRLGERCSLGSFARIWNYADVVIGDDFISAGGLTLNTATHDIVTLEPYAEPIHIGDRVWCGINVTILAGVTVGNDVVIGAGSVVVASIPSNSVVGGVPAKVIKALPDRDAAQLWSWVG